MVDSIVQFDTEFDTPKKKSGFDKLYDKVEEYSAHCSDFYIRGKDIDIERDDLNFFIDEADKYYGFTKWSFYQFCNKLGIPSGYFMKLYTDGFNDTIKDNKSFRGPDLACQNFEFFLQRVFPEKRFFVRTYKDACRGFLSERFSAIETPDILEAVEPLFEKHQVVGSYINPERFHARLIQNKEIADGIFAGVQVDTSDVGLSKLKVQYLVYRQVCTNGLILPKSGNLFTQKHIGIDLNVFRDKVAASMETIPGLNKELVANIKRANEQKFDLKALEFDPEAHKNGVLINELTRKVKGLSDETIMSIIEETKQRNMWSFINAITQTAQTVDLEKRIEMESFAGTLLAA